MEKSLEEGNETICSCAAGIKAGPRNHPGHPTAYTPLYTVCNGTETGKTHTLTNIVSVVKSQAHNLRLITEPDKSRDLLEFSI